MEIENSLKINILNNTLHASSSLIESRLDRIIYNKLQGRNKTKQRFLLERYKPGREIEKVEKHLTKRS